MVRGRAVSGEENRRGRCLQGIRQRLQEMEAKRGTLFPAVPLTEEPKAILFCPIQRVEGKRDLPEDFRDIGTGRGLAGSGAG